MNKNNTSKYDLYKFYKTELLEDGVTLISLTDEFRESLNENQDFENWIYATPLPPLPKLNTKVSLKDMFYKCRTLAELDLSNFDTSNVVDMKFMFYWCTSLLELDLSSFDTSNVTDMWGMFKWCSSLEELEITNFNTKNVTSMSGMFDGCESATRCYMKSVA
ncbi:MAG: BspA family leucine-rich repeat surface protein [bacterium]